MQSLFYLYRQLVFLSPFVVILVSGCLLFLCALLLWIFNRRTFFPFFTLFIGCLGGLFLYPHAEFNGVFLWACAYVAYACVLRCLLFIPSPKKRKKEDLFQKFYIPLNEEKVIKSQPQATALPPKISGEARCRAVSDVRLEHVRGLIEQLQERNLSASDRLEIESISARLNSYEGKPLTEEEGAGLNDCLTTVLRMTAKYSL